MGQTTEESTDTCEIRGCDRKAVTTVPNHNPHNESGSKSICAVCKSAYDFGRTNLRIESTTKLRGSEL